jgi:CxxC motif-containing protein (DUF1111 family)
MTKAKWRIAWTSALLTMLAAAPGLANLEIQAGKALFERLWVAAPASTVTASGLGPLFNARSCASCHEGGGGIRLVTTDDGTRARGLVVRVGDADGGPDPTLGRQLQVRALPGLSAEAALEAWPTPHGLGYAVRIAGLSPRSVMEPRAAPVLFGRGWIEEVSDAAVAARADPEDRDGDGISGRVHLVDGGLGRYGHKATSATLEDEVSKAAALDLGLSSPRRPDAAGDCTAVQLDCRLRAMSKREPDLSIEAVALLARYVASLTPPNGLGATSGDGATIFAAIGCAACHVPNMPNANGELRTIYSDLLLHDMGEALAGDMPEGNATAAEWRTAPLIALSTRDGRRYLHDGRADDLARAIRWHGGEAEASRRAYEALATGHRQSLMEFLENL